MAEMTKLQGMIANGKSYTAEELAKIKAYYGFTDDELKTVSEKMQTFEKEAEETTAIETGERYAQLIEIGFRGGEIKIDEDTTQTIKAEDYDDVDDIVRNLLGIQDMNDPAVKKGIEIFQNKINADLADDIAEGKYVSKAELDRLAEFGAFEGGKDSEVYQKLLASAQKETSVRMINAIKSGGTKEIIATLKYLGVDTENVSDENSEVTLLQIATELEKTGDIKQDDLKSIKTEVHRYAIADITDSQDFEKCVLSMKNDGYNAEEMANILGDATVKFEEGKKVLAGSRTLTYYTIVVSLPNGTEIFREKEEDFKNRSDILKDVIVKMIPEAKDKTEATPGIGVEHNLPSGIGSTIK